MSVLACLLLEFRCGSLQCVNATKGWTFAGKDVLAQRLVVFRLNTEGRQVDTWSSCWTQKLNILLENVARNGRYPWLSLKNLWSLSGVLSYCCEISKCELFSLSGFLSSLLRATYNNLFAALHSPPARRKALNSDSRSQGLHHVSQPLKPDVLKVYFSLLLSV